MFVACAGTALPGTLNCRNRVKGVDVLSAYPQGREVPCFRGGNEPSVATQSSRGLEWLRVYQLLGEEFSTRNCAFRFVSWSTMVCGGRRVAWKERSRNWSCGVLLYKTLKETTLVTLT